MSDNARIEALEAELSQATQTRDEHVANMGNEFSQANIDRLSALQQQVAAAKAALEEAQSAPAQESLGNTDMCVVSLIKSGKSDRVVEVPSDTSVDDLMATFGWPTNDHTFKRRVGPGQTIEITNLSSPLGEGNHEIFVSPRVSGGCR